MSSTDWFHGYTIDGKADHAKQATHGIHMIYRPHANSGAGLGDNSTYGRVDATHLPRRFQRSPRRPTHRKKSSHVSPHTSVAHIETVPSYIDSPAVDLSAYAKFHQQNYPVGTIQSVSMLDLDRPRSRKERTFVGGQCAACELSLEHKLSGEKVLQFSCGHLAHETCLYEYIQDEEEPFCPTCDAPLGLDASRGGNILDIKKLSSMVQSIPQPTGEMSAPPPGTTSSKPWDVTNTEDISNDVVESKPVKLSKLERLTGKSLHSRNNSDSSNSSNTSNTQSTDSAVEDARKHDYDVSATEGKIPVVAQTKDIPRPKVTIRSEFPTLTRSSQPQSLTCLVTVEVPGTRTHARAQTHPKSAPAVACESARALEIIATDLKTRVDNWHGLDVDKFGPLRLHANLKVGRDGTNWQKLDCFLFSELLICVREKRATHHTSIQGKPPFQLKGSILIRKHLRDVQSTGKRSPKTLLSMLTFSEDELVLTLNLVVATLPTFRLKFATREQLDLWKLALFQLDLPVSSLFGGQDDQDSSGAEDEDHRRASTGSSNLSGTNSASTAATDYADHHATDFASVAELHMPIDLVVVLPLSSSMQGLKIRLLKDALRFIITQLGARDRMALVTFGSNGGALPVVGMAAKDWYGWRDVYRSIKPVGQKSLRADAVEGANVALDLLSQRQEANPVSSVFLISDSPTYETEGMDAVVRRAHANKASVYTFGLGQTHKPDNLIELSSRTNASYVYVKDWMMLRECVAGCLGSLQSVSHTSAKLKLKIPEGSIAKFVKVSGALHTKKQATGRDAEAVLGDLRFGDKRDILVQLMVEPDASLNGDGPKDHWDSLVSGLTTLGGSLDDHESRRSSIDEVPLIQADLSFGDFAKGGATAHLSQPSLLAITILPPPSKSKRISRGSIMPPIPSHPSIIQRRMEMLTSDMLSRALTLVSKSQHESAHRLLTETRTILQGLGKGSLPPLPPLPPTPASTSGHSRSSSVPKEGRGSPRSIRESAKASPRTIAPPSGRASPKPADEAKDSNRSLPLDIFPHAPRAAVSIDQKIMHALDTDIQACLEFIDHPAVFSHDARKAALQTIGVISSQRGYTFRTETESFWAGRISGIKTMGEVTKDWQMVGNDTLTETIAED